MWSWCQSESLLWPLTSVFWTIAAYYYLLLVCNLCNCPSPLKRRVKGGIASLGITVTWLATMQLIMQRLWLRRSRMGWGGCEAILPTAQPDSNSHFLPTHPKQEELGWRQLPGGRVIGGSDRGEQRPVTCPFSLLILLSFLPNANLRRYRQNEAHSEGCGGGSSVQYM